jgi:hypothetical protein
MVTQALRDRLTAEAAEHHQQTGMPTVSAQTLLDLIEESGEFEPDEIQRARIEFGNTQL